MKVYKMVGTFLFSSFTTMQCTCFFSNSKYVSILWQFCFSQYMVGTFLFSSFTTMQCTCLSQIVKMCLFCGNFAFLSIQIENTFAIQYFVSLSSWILSEIAQQLLQSFTYSALVMFLSQHTTQNKFCSTSSFFIISLL